jgi:hypothetical protein
LDKSFCYYISDFVTNNVARVVVFAFTNKFALEGALPTGDIRVGDENENLEVFQTTELRFVPIHHILQGTMFGMPM